MAMGKNKKLSKVVKVLRKEIGERDSELDQLLNDHEVLKNVLAETRHSLRRRTFRRSWRSG